MKFTKINNHKVLLEDSRGIILVDFKIKLFQVTGKFSEKDNESINRIILQEVNRARRVDEITRIRNFKRELKILLGLAVFIPVLILLMTYPLWVS